MTATNFCYLVSNGPFLTSSFIWFCLLFSLSHFCYFYNIIFLCNFFCFYFNLARHIFALSFLCMYVCMLSSLSSVFGFSFHLVLFNLWCRFRNTTAASHPHSKSVFMFGSFGFVFSSKTIFLNTFFEMFSSFLHCYVIVAGEWCNIVGMNASLPISHGCCPSDHRFSLCYEFLYYYYILYIFILFRNIVYAASATHFSFNPPHTVFRCLFQLYLKYRWR